MITFGKSSHDISRKSVGEILKLCIVVLPQKSWLYIPDNDDDADNQRLTVKYERH